MLATSTRTTLLGFALAMLAGWLPSTQGEEKTTVTTNTQTVLASNAYTKIPQISVTRQTYMDFLEDARLLAIVEHPDQGIDGVKNFMPVLAKYVQTGDEKWGKPILVMLQSFHAGLKKAVEQEGWTWKFIEEPAFLPLYRKYLVAGGLMTEDSPLFKEIWLYYCRNLHVWSTKPIEWRGGCHRSLPEALAKGLAAKWYPDIPEARHWARFAELGFGDFWQYKEVLQNDSHYFRHTLLMLLCCGKEYAGERLFQDPEMRRIWDRLMEPVTPDGAVTPYGVSDGWNTSSAFRVFALEKLASETGRGEYRYVAQKLMNQISFLNHSTGHRYVGDEGGKGQDIALASLVANDKIEPKAPSSESFWSKRYETVRIWPRDKAVAGKYYKDLDPAPDRAQICCGWAKTGKLCPDKLVLRSGWTPGDFFALVELYPAGAPLNPGAILGMTRYGASFTGILSAKAKARENRLVIIDVDGTTRPRYSPDPNLIDEEWTLGKMLDVSGEVTYFQETPAATYAKLRVKNQDGLPVVYEREFVFAKNRFLATREIVTFEEGFHARAYPIWNTQAVRPETGATWANVYMDHLTADNGQLDLPRFPGDLLVWFAPRADGRFEVVDRIKDDPFSTPGGKSGNNPHIESAPKQVRYLWDGTTKPGQKLVFTQVYYPHQQAVDGSGIKVLRDDPQASVLRLELEPGRVEWVLFNPEQIVIERDGAKTSKSYEYRRGEKFP